MKKARTNKIRVLFIFFCILNLYLTASCQRNVSVENRDFVDTIGVDLVGEEIQVTLLIPDPSKVAEGESEVNQVVKAKAGSFTQAIRNADYKSSKKLSLENARVILFGDTLAKDEKKLDLIFDAIKRNNVISKRVIVAIADEGDAEDILTEKLENTPIFGQYLVDYYNQSPDEIFNAYDKKLSKLISKLNLIHNAIVPTISVEDSRLKLENGILFSYGKYIDSFDSDILRGYALLNDEINNIVLEVEYNDEKIPITIKSRKSIICFMENDESILIDVNQEYECLITEFYGDVSNVDIDNLEEIFNDKIEDEISNSFNYFINGNNSDIYGFQDKIMKDNYDLYEKYTNDVDDENFVDKLDFNIQVKSKIISTGSIK